MLLQILEICLPLRFTKRSIKNLQLDDAMMTVNNFFGLWFIDIDIRRYPDDLRILPRNNSVDIYQYSNAQMKYLPEKSVKKLLNTMLYSNKPVYLAEGTERKPHDDNGNDEQNRSKFQKHIYRIPLGLICDLGLVNFSFKTDLRFIITLERNMNKLFESNKKLTAIPDNPNAFINVYDRPYIAYKEINLTQPADIYFTGILRSETAFRQGVSPAPYQQLFEIAKGTQSFTCTFKRVQR